MIKALKPVVKYDKTVGYLLDNGVCKQNFTNAEIKEQMMVNGKKVLNLKLTKGGQLRWVRYFDDEETEVRYTIGEAESLEQLTAELGENEIDDVMRNNYKRMGYVLVLYEEGGKEVLTLGDVKRKLVEYAIDLEEELNRRVIKEKDIKEKVVEDASGEFRVIVVGNRPGERPVRLAAHCKVVE